ncbi:hypothetical protein CEN39_00675 [Fischerella thermalis CCMEE 5201]|jgi:hypothetical protein|nr:hypothetical protein CEN39_00675 [Fischerella thermalis CCMEE 5201]
MLNPKHEQILLYLNQALADYEVIPANFGWHIHKGDKYCGHLEYQEKKGWQGSALKRLPSKLVAELKKFSQLRFLYTNLSSAA